MIALRIGEKLLLLKSGTKDGAWFLFAFLCQDLSERVTACGG